MITRLHDNKPSRHYLHAIKSFSSRKCATKAVLYFAQEKLLLSKSFYLHFTLILKCEKLHFISFTNLFKKFSNKYNFWNMSVKFYCCIWELLLHKQFTSSHYSERLEDSRTNFKKRSRYKHQYTNEKWACISLVYKQLVSFFCRNRSFVLELVSFLLWKCLILTIGLN